jgi:flagella basal body P-ring formation protein FlgA
MTPLQTQPTVRRLTIAALLGTIPAVSYSQSGPTHPGAATVPTTGAGTSEIDRSIDRVAVAAHEIARGSTLTATDIAYAPRDARTRERSRSAAPGTNLTPAVADDSLVGFTTRRLLAAGEPLRAPAVVAPQLVKSGDLVEVVWGQDGILVTLRGRATRSAGVGERIAVRVDSQRKLEGTVIAAGRVRVN